MQFGRNVLIFSGEHVVTLSYHEDGDESFIRNAGKFLSDCTVLHSIRQHNQDLSRFKQ